MNQPDIVVVDEGDMRAVVVEVAILAGSDLRKKDDEEMEGGRSEPNWSWC